MHRDDDYTYKGVFRPVNPQKYKGNPMEIIYRSSWELTLMSKMDRDDNVEWWSSEETIVPYSNPAKPGAQTGQVNARYFPDFVVHYKDGRTVMIEVKPFKEISPPRRSKRAKTSRRFLKEAATYAINYRKWEAAKKYCEERGWQFVIMTENEIYGRRDTQPVH